MKYRLGREKSPEDTRTLRFADYLIKPTLADPPVAANWYSNVPKWDMYGNDVKGDCTFAALGHQQNAWTTYANGVEGGPSLAQVLSAYHAVSPNDTGASMLGTLKYMARHGLGGSKISAYVALDLNRLHQVELAIQMFGGVYIGLSLPDAIANAPDPLKAPPWAAPPKGPFGIWAPDPKNGHAVVALGYSVRGRHTIFDFVTWGALIGMTWSFFRDYVDEIWAIISPQWISAASGMSPSGFNLTQLLADRAAVAALPS